MAMAGEEQVYYVDVASAIKDETGGLPAEFTTDGLHFKGEYYNKWIDISRNTLCRKPDLTAQLR